MASTTDSGIHTVTFSADGESVTFTPEDGPRFDRLIRRNPGPPQETEFDDEDFLSAPALEALAEQLIQAHPDFEHLRRARVVYLWKRRGGQSKGAPILGKLEKPSGLLKHFAASHYVVWLAADHVRQDRLGSHDIEALLFHELCHTTSEVDEDSGIETFGTVGHDLETFAAEIREYGLWDERLRLVGQAIQARLPLGDAAHA